MAGHSTPSIEKYLAQTISQRVKPALETETRLTILEQRLEEHAKHTSAAIDRLALTIENNNTKLEKALESVMHNHKHSLSWSNIGTVAFSTIGLLTALWAFTTISVQNGTQDIRTTVSLKEAAQGPRDQRQWEVIRQNTVDAQRHPR
jgi:hypothetical protein